MKILLLGGTGAIGCYLQEELEKTGWDVYVTSRKARQSSNAITYIQGNARSINFLKDTLSESYDVVVDFMTWSVEEFAAIKNLFLESTSHYVFLSSYRVFADASIVDENSPRLLDVCIDEKYRKGDEYAVVKAREENTLFNAKTANWTIVRPAITFSGLGSGRFQLGTYEKDLWLWRALNNRPIPLVKEMMDTQCTLTWAGDVAYMISRLVASEKAKGETFNVATNQHQTWGEVLELYRSVIPVETCWVSVEQYESHCGSAIKKYGYIPQLRYDRMVDRVLDTSKVLKYTGLTQGDLSDVSKRLPYELSLFLDRTQAFVASPAVQGRLDRISHAPISFSAARCADNVFVSGIKYAAGRLGLG